MSYKNRRDLEVLRSSFRPWQRRSLHLGLIRQGASSMPFSAQVHGFDVAAVQPKSLSRQDPALPP